MFGMKQSQTRFHINTFSRAADIFAQRQTAAHIGAQLLVALKLPDHVVGHVGPSLDNIESVQFGLCSGLLGLEVGRVGLKWVHCRFFFSYTNEPEKRLRFNPIFVFT